MKKKIILLFSLLIIIPTIAIAHQGRTDSSGGHYNRSTGEYHYHHGYSAHQHPNGICPYDYNDKTVSSSVSTPTSSSNTSSLTVEDVKKRDEELSRKEKQNKVNSKTNIKEDEKEFSIFYIILIIIIICCSISILKNIISNIIDKYKSSKNKKL